MADKMTWLNYINLFSNSLQDVSIPESGPIPCVSRWLRKLPREAMLAGDEAAQHFARHWKWQPLQGELRYQLYFRSLYAIHACTVLGEAKAPEAFYSPDMAQKTIEMLLIECWHKEGFEWADHFFPAKKKPDGEDDDSQPTSFAC